jgi:hypothetical protein
MFMQIFATLFIGGFITLALIGHIALFRALFLSPRNEPSQPRLVLPVTEPALRTA